MQAIADVGFTIRCRTSSRPAASASSSPCSLVGPRQGPEAIPKRCSTSSRSTPTSGSWRSSCSTSTTSTPPSRSSTPATSPAKRPPTRTRGRSIAGAYAALNRHELRPTTPDWVNIDHRAATCVRARRPDRIHPCRVGTRPDIQHLHRGCASAERPRSGRHPCGAWDLARGLRRRVAGYQPSDGRRRHDQPLRDLRRGRPRRRAREVRSAQPAGTAAGKRGKPSVPSASWRTSRPATGMRMAKILADDISADDRRRVVNAGIRHGRDAEIAKPAGGRRPRDHEHDVRRHRDPWRAPRPQSCRSSGRDQRPEAFHTEVLGVVEIDADNGSRHRRVRPRRLRRRHRGTRRPIPRRRSGRPRAHMVGHRRRAYAALNRRELPATTPDCGEHRPPARGSVRAR